MLGVSALQLSPDRDPLAPHAESPRAGDLDLRALVARGWLRTCRRTCWRQPPRIEARNATERAALGYLHGNCSHCHNASDSGAGVPVHLDLAYDATDPRGGSARTLRALFGASRFTPHGAAAAQVVAPGATDKSVLVQRLRSRDARTQMPPLGTDIPDAAALALIERWITLEPKKETMTMTRIAPLPPALPLATLAFVLTRDVRELRPMPRPTTTRSRAASTS